MATSENTNKCADCKHAEFADYDNMTCSKGVTANKRSNCDLFEALLTDKEPASYILSGKLNEIIEEDKAITVEIEKEKQQNVQIVSILLKDELKDVQIGRLDPDTKFYISETTQHKNVKKIVTTDEREAILISHPDAYKVITDPLWTAITVITVIATIIIALYIIVSVVSATGYLVFWAFGLIIIGYIIFIVVGAPIYLIANRIRKYF